MRVKIAIASARSQPFVRGNRAGLSRRHRFTWRRIRRLELHSDAGIGGRFGAGAVAHGDAAHNSSAGKGPGVASYDPALPSL
jgi:hypothetical protein